MIRPAVCADAPGIYTLICALEETRFPQEIFAWGLDIMLGSPSHILLVSEEQGGYRWSFAHAYGVSIAPLRKSGRDSGTDREPGSAFERNRCCTPESCQSTGGAAALHSVCGDQ